MLESSKNALKTIENQACDYNIEHAITTHMKVSTFFVTCAMFWPLHARLVM